MTGKETKKSGNSGAEAGGKSQANQGKGIKSRLTDAQREMLESKSRGGAASQSVGHSHKPTHVSGKQGPAEKKVRW
ncbi:hypothetical protein [Arthrobacter sp. AL12]|uniref:hypothetical protein n=1 Tax=Arthrobacter sp. AL12 TaxID=3042241 RepID=UPI00249C97D5|nr:hypothetical protein [Arthrobacter sp. AL12]MDI3210740.1 hypothetical protein [Arthrobacter sp. AL12]